MCSTETILGKIVEKIVETVFQSVGRHVGFILHYKQNLKNLDDEVNNLQKQRSSVQGKVDEAKRCGEAINNNVSDWLNDADETRQGVIDNLRDEKTVKENMLCFNFSCPNFISRYRLSKQAGKEAVHVKHVTEEGGKIENGTVSHPKEAPPELEFPYSRDYEGFNSRDKVIKGIVEALKDPEVNMIGVYGTGGVGKTTMVTKVGELVKKDGTFDEVVMAVVSKDANVKQIQGQLADRLILTLRGETEVGRANGLWNRLDNGMKNLILLDDVRQELNLKEIGIPIIDGNKNCKVVLTSRNRDVWKNMDVKDFKIEILSEEESWALFKKKVGNYVDAHKQREIAWAVCKECQGLPAAIIALGEALKDKDMDAWQDELGNLKNSMLNKIEGINPKVFTSLKWSYDQSDSEDGKSCINCNLVKKSSYINAAFRSSRTNEAYLFMKDEYLQLDYAPCTNNDRVLNGPLRISEGYPSLKNTTFVEPGIDCAFGSHHGDEAFIFSGNLCARINYAPGTTNDKIIHGPMTIIGMFPFFKGTVFESGVDSAFESTVHDEAYIFKGNQYALINYNDPHLIAIRHITKGFVSLKDTIFESGIEAAFASHRANEAYLFKGDSYACINFAPHTTNDYTTVKKILSFWPSLQGILPRKIEGINPKVFTSLKWSYDRLDSEDAKSCINCNLVKKSSYINAAFRSSRTNEAYLFMKDEYLQLDYAPGTYNDRVLNGPLRISEGYPSLKNTTFAESGIDCAFGSHHGDEAFIFSGNLCAQINYAPGTTNDKIIHGPMTIIGMFPFFKGTVFESGVDSAFESTVHDEAYLFKGNQYTLINYNDSHLIAIRHITEGFVSLKDTIFESGIEAAFASHRTNEAYLFKGDSYACINFAPHTTNDYTIVKKILSSWPSLQGILPRKN
ncbi:hypothetical protein RHGRI_011922 [Rhododendron griersonianum]|uniref:NB-ARC domain-containing protein n=1 Tax=Rhododendron griersonianum TaxID=479676 RepID=A0AAV6KPN3_9ERIC|nr:hypothetical protein RHGRI_011922 [Rhododendron griersonianum]